MSLERLLNGLSKVKGRKGAWTASCPAHEDKSPSLAIRQTEDGRILLHCFGGCSVHSVVGALGMELSDLFPDKGENRKGVKPAFYATDLLKVISFETLLVSICASDMARGKQLSERDQARLKKASQRIQEAARYAGI